MKTLRALGTFNIDDTNPIWLEHLNDVFINPLAKLGFEVQAYGHQFYDENTDDDNTLGIHTLIFELSESKRLNDIPKITDIVKIMTDDDSQPHSTFQYYFGTLWLFIPYCG